MKARQGSPCPGCTEWIVPGQDISVLTGWWMHDACKKAEIQRRIAAAGSAVELPAVMPPEGGQVAGVKLGNRRHFRSLRSRGGRR